MKVTVILIPVGALSTVPQSSGKEMGIYEYQKNNRDYPEPNTIGAAEYTDCISAEK